MSSKTEVLIIGAGPTGLTMALELSRHGIRSRIVDKLDKPTDKSKAFGIHARTLELFDNMGVINDFLQLGTKVHGVNFYNDGKKLAHIYLEKLESKYPYLLTLPQSETERILTEKLEKYGVSIERGIELEKFYQNDHEVSSLLRKSDGTSETITSQWLIGCDGAHSSVRKLLNIPFKGAPYEDYWLLADITLDWDFPLDELHTFFHPEGLMAYFPLKGGRGRLIFDLQGYSIEKEMPYPKVKDVQRYAQTRANANIKVHSPEWISAFRIHHRLVADYGKGNIFLAGDAAHIHSPAGGQGMNTGIQDAYNLAWKLALVQKKLAHSEILKTYQIERHRIAEDVVQRTDFAMKMIGIRNPVFKVMRNKALSVVTKIDMVHHRIIQNLSQIEVHYKGSSICREDWNFVKGIKEFKAGSEDLVPGERIPDYLLFENHPNQFPIQLYELLQGSRHELLIFTGLYPTDEDYKLIQDILLSVNERCQSVVKPFIIKGERDLPENIKSQNVYIDRNFQTHEAFHAGVVSLYLIRPDGYIAYRNQPASLLNLMEYLKSIFNI